MFRKFLYVVSFIVVLILLFFLNLDSIRSFVVSRLNEDQKQNMREIFFGSGEAQLFKKYKIFGKMNYNQNLLPATQFLRIDFQETKLNDIKLDESNSKWNPNSIQFYLESYKDDIILADYLAQMKEDNKRSIYKHDHG